MLGHFGEGSYELAAIGIAGLFTWMLMTILWPLSLGVQALASRRYGRQIDDNGVDTAHRTGQVLDNGLVTALGAVGLAFFLSLGARPLLSRLLDSQEILELALQYIAIMRIALIPNGIFFIIQGFMGAINQTKPVMYSSLLTNFLNIFLNWVLIYGNLGFPVLGIRGAALGTLLSTVVAVVYLLGVLAHRGWIREYHLFRFEGITRGVQKSIVRSALPPGIQNFFALLIFLVYQTLVEGYGAVYLAATHVLFSYFRLNKTIISGFARSASILAGNALGRGDTETAQRAITASGLVGALVALGVGITSLSFRGPLSSLFTADAQVQAIMVQGLVFFSGFYFIEALGYAFEMVFTGNGYGRYVLYSELGTNVVFILGASLLARYFFPGQVWAIWFTFGLYQVFHAFFMILGWRSRRWLMAPVESHD